MKVLVLGLGLIGGSIGLAARRHAAVAGLPLTVFGYDPDPAIRERALARGALDEVSDDIAVAVGGAGAVFVAAPVGALAQTVPLALAAAPSDCVVTDTGSTKRALLAALADLPGTERFIGGHPLAGSEQGGIEHARADLFDGAAWCLMPAPDGVLRARLHELIEAFGAHPVELDAIAHDRLMARISQLPHVLANALIELLAGEDEREQAIAAAGPSFRDATRVAGASTMIWTDIYLSNADMLTGAIEDLIVALTHVRDSLRAGDAAALARWNEAARAARAAIPPPA